MTCIIIEDQAPAQRILKKYIEDIGTLELLGTFSDTIKALAFLSNNKVDLIFLDIHLPKMTGMEFLRIKPTDSYVILTTAYSDYALESYEYNVVDYLLKPFPFQRFVQAVSKVQGLLSPKTAPETIAQKEVNKEIFIKSGHDHIKLKITDIEFIKASADYSEIVTGSKKHLSIEPLKYWLEYLPTDSFVQVHKSYIINIARIQRVSGNRVFTEKGIEIPIGRVYKERFTAQFLKT